MTFYDSARELFIYKRTFWKNTHPTSSFQDISRSFSFFKEFFQESYWILGVSRSFQELPGVAAILSYR